MKYGLYQMEQLEKEERILQHEQKFQKSLSILSFYRAWNLDDLEGERSWLRQVTATSRDILLTWEPWALNKVPPHDQPEFRLQRILSGHYDDYIRGFGRCIRDLERPILLRPMHEMNGNWYPWCGTVNGNTPHHYVRMWHHLWRLFSEEGVRNVQWVWSPYTNSYPNLPENEMDCYFPGDDCVDWIALDGYNWGRSKDWSSWQTFEDLFLDSYMRLTRLSKKPLMIAETGSSEDGGCKAEWIQEAFRVIKKEMPRLKAFVWFDENKECDWRICSSEKSLHAFREA